MIEIAKKRKKKERESKSLFILKINHRFIIPNYNIYDLTNEL